MRSLALALLLAAPVTAADKPRPNVLVIVADDLGYTDLGVTGSEIRTPHLDALARAGLLLTSFLVAPACSPTRAMLLTGVDTHPAGLGTMLGQADENQKGRPGYEAALSDRVVPVTALLQKSGYHTYLAGKWHLGSEDAQGPQARGFERSFVLLPGGASHFEDATTVTEEAARAQYREDGRVVAPPAGFYSTAAYTDKLIEQIRGGLADGRPFFAYAAYTSPHWPLQVPDAELDRYRGAYDGGYDVLRARRFEAARRLRLVPASARVPARTPFAPPWVSLSPDEKIRSARVMELYAAMVENLDRHVGRLLQFLKDSGRYDDTLILFFSDNGAEGNAIDRLGSNAEWLPRRFDNSVANLGRVNSYAWPGAGWAQAATPFRLWKSFPTEGGIRVPAIVRFGATGRRGRDDRVVTVKDVAPTALELAGVTHPGTSFEGRPVAPLEGRSMVSFLAGRAPRVHRSDFSMGFELFGRRALRQGRYKIVWLYEPYGPGRWELFDLAPDPLESKDLAASRPAKLAELVRAWDAYAARAGVVLPTRDRGYALDSAPAESNGRAPEREWRVNSGTADGRRFSPLDQINRDNVRQLEPAWVYRTDDMASAPASTIQCTPIVVDGVMYLTTPGLKLIALQAASGRKLWEFDPFPGERARGTNRGVTYWSDGRERRIFLGAGNHLHAIDAATGTLVRSFGKDGRVDLREGLDRDVFSLSVIATSPGIVFEDLLIVGSMVGEGPGPSAPGHVRAYDVRTGERRWIFHTIPHPGEPGYETWPPDAWKTAGGANAWGGFTLDARRGLVFFGTGSAAYDHWGGDRVGANLYANSIVALHARTGERAWHFQAVHHDIWDYDLPCPPVLVSVKRDGKLVDAVAQTMKVGHLFLLERETGEPLFPVEERPVPRSELPGEASWPTQPFPTRPPPYARQRFTEAEVTDLSPAARDAILEQLRGMRTGDVFLPPGLQPNVVLPQFNGGAEWGGSAFDAASGLLYVNASNEAEWISMVPAKPDGEMTLHEIGQHLYQAVCTNCHGSAERSLAGVKGRLSREQIQQTIAAGRGQMPAFAILKPLELKALSAFLLGEGQGEKHSGADLELSFAGKIPYVMTGHNVFRDPEGYPANKGPWGTLTAIDLAAGELRFQVPLGTYPALEARGLPPTGTFNMGGPLVTAGGLVFIGAAMDERFHAFDAATGKLLWEFQMDAGGYASPATFETDGRQYVVIAAGGGGKPETRPGNAYYCFALPRASSSAR
ncbi:MAG TPA: sulfatase-like hydrolase/transferase [Vicinamibacteria bacterium]